MIIKGDIGKVGEAIGTGRHTEGRMKGQVLSPLRQSVSPTTKVRIEKPKQKVKTKDNGNDAESTDKISMGLSAMT